MRKRLPFLISYSQTTEIISAARYERGSDFTTAFSGQGYQGENTKL